MNERQEETLVLFLSPQSAHCSRRFSKTLVFSSVCFSPRCQPVGCLEAEKSYSYPSVSKLSQSNQLSLPWRGYWCLPWRYFTETPITLCCGSRQPAQSVLPLEPVERCRHRRRTGHLTSPGPLDRMKELFEVLVSLRQKSELRLLARTRCQMLRQVRVGKMNLTLPLLYLSWGVCDFLHPMSKPWFLFYSMGKQN